jgi:hypothetical protein
MDYAEGNRESNNQKFFASFFKKEALAFARILTCLNYRVRVLRGRGHLVA